MEQKYIDAYKLLESQCGIGVGDVVKILRKVEPYSLGWNVFWNSEMDDSVGKEFKVVDINRDGIRLQNDFYYPFFALQFVKKAKPQVSISLNSEYTAVVDDNGVTVGCQVFPLKVAIELGKAAKKFISES
jgi:hypothetical protein